MSDRQSRWVSVGRVAAAFGVSTKTLHRWGDAAPLRPAMRTFSGHRRYLRTDVEAFGSERVLTTTEVAALCGVTGKTVSRWVREKRLAGIRAVTSGHYRFLQSEVDRFLESYRPHGLSVRRRP